MPRIFDNIAEHLLPALRASLQQAYRADLCVGYFNLRGWQHLADAVEHFAGDDQQCCRILVGMYRLPEAHMQDEQRALQRQQVLDGPNVYRLREAAAQHFRTQLQTGIPTTQAQATLQKLAHQLRSGVVRVRSVIGGSLHAKLYLTHRRDQVAPIVGYLGSSNLTFSGLQYQGELNVDVTDGDAAEKLQRWFDDRWNEPRSCDISAQLADLIEQSWAADRIIQPYHVYLKMAHHLSAEAQQGEREFRLPAALRGVLLDFQERAVSLAAYLLHHRGGVLLGDVVGLGKTLMATAVAKLFQEDDGSNVLIICPPKLEAMWRWYLQEYKVAGDVLSLGKVTEVLPSLMRYRLVVIDESHNLRNREGRRYAAVQDYIERNEARVMLLTATPYNKLYADVANQLRLFVDENQDLRVRPERFWASWLANNHNEADFVARFQTSPRSLRAFEQSPWADDWRDVLRLFMVRRTRHFIVRNYATFDKARQRYFVHLNGQPFYFPLRQPQTLTFPFDETNPHDQYARLYHPDVVATVESLALPRYGLAEYVAPDVRRVTAAEQAIVRDLNQAGRRLRGFSRTNLFKRLESSGWSFLLSLAHHVARNSVVLYALDHNLSVPIGAQNAALFDTVSNDMEPTAFDDDGTASPEALDEFPNAYLFGADAVTYQTNAATLYAQYAGPLRSRFKWLPSRFFTAQLRRDLQADTTALLAILGRCREWLPSSDTKLYALDRLLMDTHRDQKVLVFTQFADTARYLGEQLRARNVPVEVVTGGAADPTALARRFSPRSNGGLRAGELAIRVLVATDVLGEGQNLQDAHIIVNYDLPWAIIRLIQRAGRVDRIGQQSDTVLLYSFVPTEGVEQVIRLRQRLAQRLRQNQEVIGSDESFFGEETAQQFRDLYTERATALQDDDGDDVDLSSVALQVWNSASAADREIALNLPSGIAAARAVQPHESSATLVYLRFPDGTDTLARIAPGGNVESQSLTAVFRAAACAADTPGLPIDAEHHTHVQGLVMEQAAEQRQAGGQLGSLRSTRRKIYERLKHFRDEAQHHPTATTAVLLSRLDEAFNLIYQHPLHPRAVESLKRQLRLGVGDPALVEMVVRFAENETLCVIRPVAADADPDEPHVVCSIGLVC